MKFILHLFYPSLILLFCQDISAELSDAQLLKKETAKRLLQPLRTGRVKRGNEEIYKSMVVMCRSKCWDEWTAWGTCSGPCNTGSRLRTRTRKTPPPECRNIQCVGSGSQNQDCVMDCGVGGNPAQDHCACLPGYIGICCDQRITCAKPRNPANGFIGGNEIWPAFYDARALYFCNPGYALIGQEQRRCQENGQWTGSNPSCQQIECNMPLPIENGEIINRKAVYHFNDVIGYECDIGYQLRGPSDRKCSVDQSGNGIWSVHPPTCEARACGDPGTLQNGRRSGTDFTFDGQVTFSCLSGYTLIGSSSRRCLSTGTWSGSQPVCKEVLCSMVENPAHGYISSRESLVNTIIVFSCDRGYRLDGNEYLACLPNGFWNGTVPQCKAIGCEHPGSFPNGAVENNGLLLGNTVRFYCHSGHMMVGSTEATCQADGSWTNSLPRCQACQMNYYKTGPANGGNCVRCPDNSHTLTQAAANQRQCICNRGYNGNPGGPCSKVSCGMLDAPENGRVVSCHNGLGQKCVFDCDDGYILIRGSSVRTCLPNSVWDGVETVCQACTQDTYKVGPSVCLPCPPKSRTSGAATSITQCVCVDGYDGENGGECKDVDECTTGKHKCQQSCTNTIGGYSCDCNIPGYKLNTDGKTCRAENQCRNLTEIDAPINGGLMCHHYTEQNSQMCTLRCNPGYEIPVRYNAYETCGPVTNYIWSYQRVVLLDRLIVDEERLLPPCLEQFFPDFSLNGDSLYFVRACNQLTEEDKFIAKRQFARTLTEQGICQQRDTRVCDMRNVNIVCGREYIVRKKRGLDYEEIAMDAVNITFNIFADKSGSNAVNCKTKICPMLRIPDAYCERHCFPAYSRFLRSAVLHAKNQLTKLFTSDKDKLTFNVAEKIFSPSEDDDTLDVSDVIVNCEEGMKSQNNSMCSPCSPGTYFTKEENNCLPCQVGYFQPNSRQSSCEKCPVGTTTNRDGSSNCTVCPVGKYGDGCAQECGRCIHGDCDPVSGSCLCHSGWEGTTCEQDIPGCDDNSCYAGVSCTDVSAPGTGFQCGACPPNMTGNGIYCVPTPQQS